MAQLLASVKHNEADIRNLLNKPIGELIEARRTYRDVRIDDIIAGESTLVEAKFRKVLASRSLAMEFDQWKKSREHPTLKDFCSRIGISYDDHRHYLSRGQKILDYEKSAVSTISVVITFCWSKAMRNNDIPGFAHQLKGNYRGLYGFLEERVGWLAECQSLYDERCVSRNDVKDAERLFICQSMDDVREHHHGGRKRKVPATWQPEEQNRRGREGCDNERRITEVLAQQETRLSTVQGSPKVASSQPERRNIDDGQIGTMQDAPRPTVESSQSGHFEEGNVGLQTQYGYPVVSAPERIQGDSTQYAGDQPNRQYLAYQYDLAHGAMLTPENSYVDPGDQYALSSTHVTLSADINSLTNIWWDSRPEDGLQ